MNQRPAPAKQKTLSLPDISFFLPGTFPHSTIVAFLFTFRTLEVDMLLALRSLCFWPSHPILSSSSSSLTPTDLMSSFATSINLFFGPLLGFLRLEVPTSASSSRRLHHPSSTHAQTSLSLVPDPVHCLQCPTFLFTLLHFPIRPPGLFFYFPCRILIIISYWSPYHICSSLVI